MAEQTDHEGIQVEDDRPYIAVSTDSHCGPIMETQLREYCPAKYLDQFDEHVRQFRQHVAEQDANERPENRRALSGIGYEVDPSITEITRSKFADIQECGGLTEPAARLADMDTQGVAADVIFPGGQNNQDLPFLGFGVDAGNPAVARELRAVGEHIWNQWMADFSAECPERLIGAMQIPIWDIDAAIKEVQWAADAGLQGINFPAPRQDLVPYFDKSYEPFWSAVEEIDLPLLTHVGGGEPPIGWRGEYPAHCILFAELDWLGRRGLWQMIFGGVFERHPKLRMVFTEQRAAWVGPTLRDLDSIWLSDLVDDTQKKLPRRPSEYWAQNCFVAGSFLARFEMEELDVIGDRNLMWGTDYPHVEGTWPNTRLSMRHTFAGYPEPIVRAVLGENAVNVYNLDRDKLRVVADKIGPTVEDLSTPLAPEEFPAQRGGAFRELGVIA